MSTVLKDLLYTKDHEWLRRTSTPKVVQIGITDFAQASLGDVTFVQVPAVGSTIKQGQSFGTVESVKAVSDLYAPVSGKVLRLNDGIQSDPAAVNTDPFHTGWLLEIEISDESEFSKLMNADAYEKIAV